MALSAATVFEVRTTGSDTNGGGFVTGASGTDYSQQDAAQYTGTTGANVNPSTTFNDTNANFGTDVVGNLLRIVSGDGTVGTYHITTRNSATSLTLDRAQGGAGTADITYNIGGALATPGMAFSIAVASNTIWIKSGTYTCSSSSNVAGGRLTTSVNNLRIIGYVSTRGDATIGDSSRPVLKAGANSMSVLTFSSGTFVFRDLIIDGDKATRTATTCATSTATGFVYNCKFMNANGNGGDNTNNSEYVMCEFADCAGYGCYANSASFCYSHGNTGNGIQTVGRGGAVRCISTGNGADGLRSLTSSVIFDSNVCYGNTGDGIEQGDTSGASVFTNNICYGNTGFGIRNSGSYAVLINNALGSNTAGATTGTVAESGTISLSSNPFIDAASGDFRLNSTAGGGLELKATSSTAAATPSAFPGLSSTTNFADIGAVQAAPSAAGGLLRHPGMTGGFTA